MPGRLILPQPAAAHPSTASIQWSGRYRLWAAPVVLTVLTLPGLIGVIVVAVRGAPRAGQTYRHRNGSIRTYNGSVASAVTPYVGLLLAALILAPMIFWVQPHRRINRFLRHWPWTEWDVTVSCPVYPDPQTRSKRARWEVVFHDARSVDHHLYCEWVYNAAEYGWFEGRQKLYFAGDVLKRGVIVRTLGDTPSMIYEDTGYYRRTEAASAH